MEKFDLRNGKTLNKKVYSFTGTLLYESNIKPLFSIYDKYRGFLGGKMETAEYKKTKIDVGEINNKIKLKLTNKRAPYIFVEEELTHYNIEDDSVLKETRYYFHRIYSDKDIIQLQSQGKNMDLDNYIRNSHTSLDTKRFSTLYIIDNFYQRGACNSFGNGQTLKDVIDTKPEYSSKIVVKDIIYSEIS